MIDLNDPGRTRTYGVRRGFLSTLEGFLIERIRMYLTRIWHYHCIQDAEMYLDVFGMYPYQILNTFGYTLDTQSLVRIRHEVRLSFSNKCVYTGKVASCQPCAFSLKRVDRPGCMAVLVRHLLLCNPNLNSTHQPQTLRNPPSRTTR